MKLQAFLSREDRNSLRNFALDREAEKLLPAIRERRTGKGPYNNNRRTSVRHNRNTEGGSI